MPTPTGVAIATTHNWISSSAAYNPLKPQVDNTDYQTFGDEDITGLMELMGSKNQVNSLIYRHFEDDR